MFVNLYWRFISAALMFRYFIVGEMYVPQNFLSEVIIFIQWKTKMILKRQNELFYNNGIIIANQLTFILTAYIQFFFIYFLL